MRYRRYYRAGGTYFFTVVANKRQPILTQDAVRLALREAVLAVREKYPFEIAAWVLMPDHLHTIWHLPENDADFSERWRQIKRHSQYLIGADTRLWQKRFWEHAIRDEADFVRHFDYVHFNPVKHRHVPKVSDWPFSTFHRYVKQGLYPQNWGGDGSDFMVAYDS
ncbi:transposase [Neisseria sp. Dent CA1/247]|uniref:REP-associated tyrosine transposase n=1 Tax=Neisseria sp. Dent CA1/247 TaxID=2912675 RepID=UPI001FD5F2D2|nr:transposase [Neisseria sp. Dent CA1/247]UOO75904.1 transposase [Neisseria sp. Dent CA1/247]